MLADALPDKFGNRLIDAWLAETGRSADRFSPVDRLCYIGNRGIGALEFEPTVRKATRSKKLELAQLVDLANRVLSERENLAGRLGGENDAEALEDILSVGTSAGGARAKAVLAWNRETGEFRSGQVKVDEGYEHWLLKFDGVSNNRDKELADPQGFGKIEYAYHLMATAAGIDMSECRLHHEGGRSHFMTRRFDRDGRGSKLHMQSLGAMQHFDFNDPASYSYEQAALTIRGLGLGMDVVEQQVRRAIFNVVARNQDDHVKNISFLMDRSGTWRLSPAYDVAYSYNPSGVWTRDHQMSLAGKRNDNPSNALSTSRVFAASCASHRMRNASANSTSPPAKVRIVVMSSSVNGIGRPRSFASFSLRAMWLTAAPSVATCAPQACRWSSTTGSTGRSRMSAAPSGGAGRQVGR
jgi:serine/threonine-protein kinase HipA